MGNWTYYVTVIRMQDLAARVQLATDIYPNPALNEQMQRSLDDKHSEKIRNFILMDEQRLFNSMVIGVYGGQPEWLSLDINAGEITEKELPLEVRNSVGILVLNGEESLYALDGQHRLVGIKKAIKDRIERGDEQVSAIFVAHKKDTEEGLIRTRRLFSRLNRYAKPVSTLDKIALDEDDLIAIIVRRLVQEHPLFTGYKVSSSRSYSISQADKYSLITLAFLYRCVNIYCKVGGKELRLIHDELNVKPDSLIIKNWTEFTRYRPEDEIIDYFHKSSLNLWDKIALHFKALKEYAEQPADSPNAEEYRHAEGGHVMFRPIGMQIYISAIRSLLDDGWDIDHAVFTLSKIPNQLSDIPWQGIIWNSTAKTMIT